MVLGLALGVSRRPQHVRGLMAGRPCWNEEQKTTPSTETETRLVGGVDVEGVERQLQGRGFTQAQAQALTAALTAIVQMSMEEAAETLSRKAEFEKFIHQHALDLEQVRKDIEVLDKTKLILVRFDIDRIQQELKKLDEMLKEEITKMKSGVRLDFSLEKGRTKEDFALQEQRIKDTRGRIDTEVGHLRTQIEQSKLDFFKYFLGALVSGASMTIAYIRLVKIGA
eukprot:comp11836_c0_seq1/m.6466 comp11836_c0_seq1/g.6466  ORF comp11836_c0_seq1/g.6466 comp11836_c0_seq1/m.6466 type:complete len:225 (-) comp11836_c0_seq1:278-952(-)